MMFNSIQEFNEAFHNCPICDKPMITRFGCTFRSVDEFDVYDQSEIQREGIRFFSTEDNDSVHYSYILGNGSYSILSINKNTSKIESNLEFPGKIQNVFWNHDINLMRTCLDHDNLQYRCFSDSLTLERKNKKICSFGLDAEFMSVPLNNDKYKLWTDYSLQRSWISSERNETLNQTLPLTYLYSIKGSENIIQKVKTILVFL